MKTLLNQLEDIRRCAQELIAGLSPEQLMRRPDPAKWSIAECLAHLNLTGTGYVPLIEAAIRRGREGKMLGKGPFKPGLLGSLLKWIAEPPPKFRFRAPENILPPSSITDPSRVIAEFMRLQDEWERLVRESDGLDLKRVKVDSPLPQLPRLRLAAPVPWMLAHERRHLLQAEKVKAEIQAKAASA
ncbi:MAG TPA: DinB family protein [Candidatus Angelobacter sp.]|nr:DinB family protein [Candidatus Angelobacter sp.]